MKIASKIKYIVLAIAAIVVVVGLSFYVHYNTQHPSTDDAYVQAHMVQINARVSGQINHVLVTDHQYVTKGQLLFSLDPKPFELKLEQAQANLLNTEQQVRAETDNRNAAIAGVKRSKADLVLAQATYNRYKSLYQQHYVAKQTLDEQANKLQVSKAALNSAIEQLAQAQDAIGNVDHMNAQAASAQAVVDQAKLNLQYTKIYAPIAGRVAQLNLRAGDSVDALQSAFTLIDDQGAWINAYFKETQLGRLAVNTPVTVSIDMYPDKVFHGTVDSVAYGSGDSFSILPSEKDSGNWVKVTQRFTVKIKLDNMGKEYPLRVGSSASVQVS